MTPRPDISMTPAEIRTLFAAPLTGVLTTLEAGGWPHSSAMWFVYEPGRILMWTYAKSQKARNAGRDPRAAFLVETGTTYSELRGVLIRGQIEVIESRTDVVDIGRRLYERYTLPGTGIPYVDGPNLEVERQADKRVGLAVPLERVASWDHSKV